jgi:hypothetical protein
VRPAKWFSRRPAGAAQSAEAPPRDLQEALVALSAAIRESSHDGSDNERLHSLVLVYCTHARRENLTPEHMLVRLKHALSDGLPATGVSPMAREATRTRVVKSAINAYYDLA